MLTLEELRAARSKRRLTKSEKLAYSKYWQSSNQSQRLFCEQEGLSLSTFSGWLKLSGLPIREESKSNFIPVEVSSHPVKKKSVAMGLQFKFPNGLIIEG